MPIQDELTVAPLFQRIFGFIPEDFNAEQVVRQEETERGTPYYATDGYGHEFWMPVKLGGVLLPNAVMSVQYPNEIVETRMVHQKGSVKEMISEGDCRMRVRGIAITDGFAYPEQQVKELAALKRELVALEIECPYTEFLEIDYAVVESFNLLESRGFKGVQAYQFSLLSDHPFELIITE